MTRGKARAGGHRHGVAAGSVAAANLCEGGCTLPRYRRVVVKLSGEALAGVAGTGADPASLARVADEVLSVHRLGVQVAVVVGGGNYFRGRMAEGWGISRAEADNIGMLGTVMNALMLRGALTGRTDADVPPGVWTFLLMPRSTLFRHGDITPGRIRGALPKVLTGAVENAALFR